MTPDQRTRLEDAIVAYTAIKVIRHNVDNLAARRMAQKAVDAKWDEIMRLLDELEEENDG